MNRINPSRRILKVLERRWTKGTLKLVVIELKQETERILTRFPWNTPMKLRTKLLRSTTEEIFLLEIHSQHWIFWREEYSPKLSRWGRPKLSWCILWTLKLATTMQSWMTFGNSRTKTNILRSACRLLKRMLSSISGNNRPSSDINIVPATMRRETAAHSTLSVWRMTMRDWEKS